MDTKELSDLEKAQNQGRGVSCIRTVILWLNRGNLEAAKGTIQSEWDKISQYPVIVKWLKQNQLAESHWYEKSY